jgi:hypothetical protein
VPWRKLLPKPMIPVLFWFQICSDPTLIGS